MITKDPESGAVNIGTYRCMVQGPNRISVKMNKGKHGRLAMDKYHANGEPCPVAIGVGQAVSLFIAAQLPLSPDQREYDVAGWLQGAPVSVVASPIHGLPIPADAELAFEGFMPPIEEESVAEGPFGEWPGYYASSVRTETVRC